MTANPHQDPLFQQATLIIQEILKKNGISYDAADIYSDLTEPPNLKLGHLAFPCFKLTKQLKKKPNEIAEQLAQNVVENELFTEIKNVGPYLNFFYRPQKIGEYVIDSANDKALFQIKSLEMKPIMIEYSQPNTHKELHVGHMRNLCFGNALVRLLKYSGRQVVATTFPGDVGTHVAKCLWYLRYHNTEPIPEFARGEWLGAIYSKAHLKLEAEKGGPKEESNRQELTAILKEIEQKNGEFYDLWKQTREWSIDLMKSVYQWADVEFDHWYWESDVDSESVSWIKQLYEEGKLQKSEGAIGYDLSEEKLGFCLLLKSDGNGLYATKDMALAKRKFEQYDPSASLYVVDMRQELHFKQVFSVLKKIGFEQADRCQHLKYNFVELPDGAMSSRKGNIVPINKLITQMKNHVKENYLDRYQGKWSESDIDTTADMVAQGAIKYGMNAMDTNKKIIFDMKAWLKLDGESGPYIQYSHARICSLIEKSDLKLQTNVDYKLLTSDIEKELMIKLSAFNKCIETCAQNLRTAPLCSYLYDVAKLFNSFYHDCPINSLEDQNLKQARFNLATATARVLNQGLGLLGIPAPDKM